MSFLPLLYQALDAPFGIVLACDNFDVARAKLYEARRQSGDPKLDDLIFAQGRDDKVEIWVVKKSIQQTSVPEQARAQAN